MPKAEPNGLGTVFKGRQPHWKDRRSFQHFSPSERKTNMSIILSYLLLFKSVCLYLSPVPAPPPDHYQLKLLDWRYKYIYHVAKMCTPGVGPALSLKYTYSLIFIILNLIVFMVPPILLLMIWKIQSEGRRRDVGVGLARHVENENLWNQ